MPNIKPWALIVDDHPIYRSGLKSVLLKTYKFFKIKEAPNGMEALKILADIPQIQVVFMDIEMPVMNGVEASKKILKLYPDIKIIVTTMFSEPKYISEMVSINVSAYILKDSSLGEITKAVEMVLDNQPYYSAKIQDIIITGYKGKKRNKVEPTLDLITNSQKQVLTLLCNQYSNSEIAKELDVSELTIKRHRQDLLERTNSKNFAGLIIFAIEHGLYDVKKKF
jgi:NarL family two-component system response regulator LiaR